jgi:hypothetical protein
VRRFSRLGGGRSRWPPPPGEYAFAMMSQGVAVMIWDFGVDTP